MGIRMSSVRQQAANNRKIEEELEKEKQTEPIKLLLLGKMLSFWRNATSQYFQELLLQEKVLY